MKNYFRIVDHPYQPQELYAEKLEAKRKVMLQAARCQYCEPHPPCMRVTGLEVRGIMRRVTVRNFVGAQSRAALP